jgi:AcrR family transcriptional regulator
VLPMGERPRIRPKARKKKDFSDFSVDFPVKTDYIVSIGEGVNCDRLVCLCFFSNDETQPLVVAPPPRAPRDVTRQQRRASRTRQRLLDAARRVFAERGLDLTRIDEITESADVGKGTFYYHFGSKTELINDLIRQVLDELCAKMNEKCSGIESLAGLVDAMVQAHIEFFSARWEDFVLYFQSRSDLALEQGYDGIETPFLQYIEHIESLLTGVVKRRLPRAVLRRIACAVAGFVSGYYSFAAIASNDENIDKTFRPLRRAIVASLVNFVQEAARSAETDQNVP